MSTLRLLVKPALFTASVCGASFCGAAIFQHERQKSSPFYLSNFTWKRPLQPASFGLNDRTQKHEQGQLLGYLVELRRRVNNWKNTLTTGEKIAYGTIFINLTVLGAWRVPALRPIMNRYFISHSTPSKIALSPMILSCFSHSMPLHFVFNMAALYSFANISTIFLGPEQLIGMYISAGVVSSFVSTVHRLATKRFTPSLGASGAVLGVVAYICIKQPESNLLLFFIPIAAGTAIKAILAIDAVGILARWSFIDHAAHLGGSLFGVWYATYGEKFYHKHRRDVAETWSHLRGK